MSPGASPPSKIALITGGGSGIGRATALALAADGWQVIITGRTSATLIETAALAQIGPKIVGFPADVTEPDQVGDVFAGVMRTFGRLDVLFNNAGSFAPATAFEDITLAVWRSVVDVNLTGSFLCAQAAIRLMKAQAPRGGRIINNGSISAHTPRPLSAPYTATKHAITGLTKSIALDGRDFDIACSQIDIGNAATDMTTGFAAGVLQADGSRKAEARMDVSHAAHMVVQIANLPLSVNVPFVTIMATAMPYIGRG